MSLQLNMNTMTILGMSIPTETLFLVDDVIHSNTNVSKIKKSGHRPNRSSVLRMALIHFMEDKISQQRILDLYSSTKDDKAFHEKLSLVLGDKHGK